MTHGARESTGASRTGASARERLLDAAEEILTAKNLSSLTVRELTRRAGVNIATVNYVFGSKDGLLIDLHERMFAPMIQERMARFDALEKAGDLKVRDLVEALIDPLEQMRQEHGAPALQLYQHMILNEDDQIRNAAWLLLAPGMRRFEELVVLALPNLPTQALRARIGLVCQIAVPTTLRALDPFGLDDQESNVDPLMDLITGGLTHPKSDRGV